MSEFKILSHPKHPLYNKIVDRCEHVILYNDDPLELLELPKNCTLFDLTLLGTQEKEKLFSKINPFVAIYSDLSCCWGDYLFEKFSHLKGAMALSFHSPQNTYEVALKEEAVQRDIEILFSDLEFELHLVSTPGLGFTLPRVCSQIINEACFAREQELASEKDIDTAMLFGVNYPLGPFGWLKESSPRAVCLLLDELHQLTGEPRYRASQYLRKRALLNE